MPHGRKFPGIRQESPCCLPARRRIVRAPDTHSAELSLVVWHIEEWIRDSVGLQATKPNMILLRCGDGQATRYRARPYQHKKAVSGVQCWKPQGPITSV